MTYRYRVQFADQRRFANWSEWRDADAPMTEPVILSLQFDPQPSEVEMKEFCRANLELPRWEREGSDEGPETNAQMDQSRAPKAW